MKKHRDHSGKKIGVIIEHWLFNVIFASLTVALIGFVLVQAAYRRYYSFNLVEDSVEDAYNHIAESFLNFEKRDMPDLVDMIESSLPDYEEDEIDDLLRRGVEMNSAVLSEFNIVNDKGIITNSSNPDNIRYDIHSDRQFAEFLCLLSGTEFYSQDLQGIPNYDSVIIHRYGAPFKRRDGFFQIGVSKEVYDRLMREYAKDTARNRNIGLDGFLIVCDKTGSIIGSTNDMFEGETFPYVDILPENTGDMVTAKLKFSDQDYYSAALTEESFCIIGCYPYKEAMRAGLIDILMVLVMNIVIAVFIFIALSRLLKKEVVVGVESLNGSLSKITDGDLDEKADFRNSLEFNQLSDGINCTVDRLKELIKEAEERIDAELAIAAKIQTSFIPNKFPAFPDRDEFELFAKMVPAKEVGGDFYDFFLVDDDHLALVIADVSGKGIPAAMFMVMSKDKIHHSVMKYCTDVAAAITEVNMELIKENGAGLFVTVWLGVVTLSTGHVDYVDAGHEYPAICRAGGKFTVDEDVHSGPVAALKRMTFDAGSFDLKPGDTLYLYTDGVTEANDPDGEMFRAARMIDALNIDTGASVEEIDANVRRTIDEYVKDAPQFDDTTTLIFRYKGV